MNNEFAILRVTAPQGQWVEVRGRDWRCWLHYWTIAGCAVELLNRPGLILAS